MRIFGHYAAWLLFSWVMLGGLFLTYAQSIDGVLINKPITYQSDPMNIKLEKHTYRHGDMVRGYISFCKTSSIRAVTSWTLEDGIKVAYPEVAGGLSAGCYDNILFDIKMIPESYTAVGDAHFIGQAEYKINNLHSVVVQLKTEDFIIVK